MPPTLRRRARRGRVVTIAILMSTALVVAGLQPARAQFGSSRSVGGSTLTTRTWYFLHNSPTPPSGNTTAVANLTMTGTPSTQPTLYNYDTNADSVAGRRIQKSGSGAGDTTLARYANWRTPAFGSARSLAGTVTLRLWSGISGFPLGQRGVLVAYLRDYNPSTGLYSEIANATLNDANWQQGTASWVLKQIDISVASYSLAAGHQLEVKVETTAAASTNMVIAYDTTGYGSFLSIP